MILFERVDSPVSSSTLNLALLVALGVFLPGTGGCGRSQPETLPAHGIASPIPNPFILEITGSDDPGFSDTGGSVVYAADAALRGDSLFPAQA